jgi:hypothetical protein
LLFCGFHNSCIAYLAKEIHVKGRETFDSITDFMNFKKKRKVRRLCEARAKNLLFKRTLRRAGRIVVFYSKIKTKKENQKATNPHKNKS